jgi:hypothetical protein
VILDVARSRVTWLAHDIQQDDGFSLQNGVKLLGVADVVVVQDGKRRAREPAGWMEGGLSEERRVRPIIGVLAMCGWLGLKRSAPSTFQRAQRLHANTLLHDCHLHLAALWFAELGCPT